MQIEIDKNSYDIHRENIKDEIIIYIYSFISYQEYF